MTKQEIAVALSHIEVWRLIADGDVPSVLVLEDDVFMPAGFARSLQATWAALSDSENDEPDFDLLYLSFKEVGKPVAITDAGPVRRSRAGIWQASGYVLTREGASKLLEQLPVRGPVDLWLNSQFENLKVFTAARSIIEQRIDEPSTNSYSMLPVLSQVGAITREKPLVAKARRMKGPVVVVGDNDSGGTAVAMALSMLGYTCCSDLAHLPAHEQKGLIQGRRTRLFNAYANIGSLDNEALAAIARSNRGALFIVTSTTQDLPALRSEQVLHLNSAVNDKWAALSDFLAVEYPSFPYPVDSDLGKRPLVGVTALLDGLPSTDLTFDSSPWILRPQRAGWKGMSIRGDAMQTAISASVDWVAGEALDHESWKLRDDTFPCNLALFTPVNFNQRPGECAILTLREEATPVRAFTSAAIATRESYCYGTFTAELRPSGVPGLITGVFLHRNGPRQEIDIEFLGKDPTKMLVNVYYNPGPGARSWNTATAELRHCSTLASTHRSNSIPMRSTGNPTQFAGRWTAPLCTSAWSGARLPFLISHSSSTSTSGTQGRPNSVDVCLQVDCPHLWNSDRLRCDRWLQA